MGGLMAAADRRYRLRRSVDSAAVAGLVRA
jgi:hypothetical protein